MRGLPGQWLVGALVFAGACGNDAPVPALPLAHHGAPGEDVDPGAAPEGEPAARGYEVAPVAATGAIVGRVRFRATRPGLLPFDVPRRQDVCGQSQPNPVFAVGPAGGFSDVVVWLDLERGALPPPRGESVVIDHVGCRLVPHISVVHPGERILFRNSDAVLHNVHAEWEDGQPWLNFGQPRRGDATVQVASRVGVAALRCDAGHPWTFGWLHVLPHPYHAVTDAEGAFRIEAVPVGTHRLRLWHSSWDLRGTASGRPIFGPPVVADAEVTVTADGLAELELLLPSPADGPRN